MMKNLRRFGLLPLALALGLAAAPLAQAQVQGESLAKCLADNTTGKDRKDLARWIFVAMASHPEIRDLASASEEAADQASRSMGALVTRLLAESCPREVQAVARGEGPMAMRRAFETLGQLAMMELTSNKDVAASITKFERYVDRAKVTGVLEGR